MNRSKEELEIELCRHKGEMAKEKVMTYFKEVIHPLLPNCNYVQMTDELIEGVHLGFGANIRLRPYNYVLKRSPYYYKTPLKFIHYTSLNNCLNIIREKSFRLYNLNSLDDKHELLFASTKIFPKMSKEEQNFWKGNIYTLSMCKYSVEQTEKSFDIWRNYGQDGLGVGFVLTFDGSNQLGWMNRHLSKIHYNDKYLLEFVSRHDLFMNKYGFPVIGNHQELLLNLCCFHKNKIYKNEQEVRYVEIENGFDKKNEDDIRLSLSFMDSYKYPITYVNRVQNAWEKHKLKYDKTITFDLSSEVDLNKNRKTSHFRRLYLDTDFRNNLIENSVSCPHVRKYADSLMPPVRIEKIILGYRYDDEAVPEIQKVINEISLKILGYQIPVEISRLKKYFRGAS